jgi:MFS family permease
MQREPAATDEALQPEPRSAKGRTSTFGSLRVRNFRLFIIGQLLSSIGTWMQLVAGPWLVLELTHGNGTYLGIDTGLQFLPMLLFGAYGGLIADRFDNRRLQLITQVAFGTLALTLWLLVITHVVQVWMVFFLSFLVGCVTAVDMPTRQSFYLEMVGRDQLTNAMSLTTATFTGSRAVGPAIAGLLIAHVDVGPVFLINAISYGAVIVALLAMRPEDLKRRERVARARGQIREGIRYIRSTPALALPMLVMAAVFLFGFNFAVILPLLATKSFHGNASTYGNLLAIFGIGSLVGSLTMASRASRPNARRLCLFAVALGVVSIAVAVTRWLSVEWALMLPLGAISIAFAIVGNSTLQLESSDAMRGRVMALYGVIFLGSNPIGGPIAGWVSQHASPRVALAAGAAIAVAAGLAGLSAVSRARAARAPATAS